MELSMECRHVLTNVTAAPSPPVDTGALLRGHTNASISTHRTAHSWEGLDVLDASALISGKHTYV